MQTVDIKHLYLDTEIHPEDPEVWTRFARGFKYLIFSRFDPVLKKSFEKCLKQPIGNLQDLERAGVSLLKHHVQFDLNDELLLGLLKQVILTDPELEIRLILARRSLLKRASAGRQVDEFLPFLTALSSQCLLNEYIYSVTTEEESILLSPSVPDYLRACYENLEKETLKFPEVPCITPIINSISLKVEAQYQQHPYPRWTGLRKSESLPPEQALKDIGLKPRILIAGCGTGQHALQTAFIYPEGEVVAIDLSQKSLQYASKKALEYGIKNVQFYQADILELNRWQNSFDLIECVGVLHHMEDPFKGWKALRSLLKEKGWMNIGLYSELGRSDIKAAKELIAAGGWQGTDADIRKCRFFLLNLPDIDPAKRVTLSFDFYTMPTCRDLLFHVHEKLFSLSVIQKMIDTLNLKFMGFDFRDKLVLDKYRERYPEDIQGVSLSQWHVFELEFPFTFEGMYQFWVKGK